MPMNQNGGTYFTVCTLNKNQENVKQLYVDGKKQWFKLENQRSRQDLQNFT